MLLRFLLFLENIPAHIIIPGFLLATMTSAYAAEDTIRGSTATTMPHSELSPYGIQKGGFTFFPSALYTFGYNDNVYATETNRQASYISDLTPSISANSIWSRHALNFDATASIGKNHSFPSEDYTDWNLGADGRLDIRHDIDLSAGVGFGHQHVDRTAPDDSRGIEPTEFDEATFFTRYTQRFGRMAGTLALNVFDKEYDDVEGIRFGIPITIDNSTRDRTEYRLRMRGSYQYVGKERVFISITAYESDYDVIGAFGLDKSSKGLETSVGADFDYHGILVGVLSVGYRSQNYHDPLPDIDTPIVVASINWNITDLTTANFGVDQSIRESINQFFSGFVSSTASVGLDHELRRDLILNLGFHYTEDEYVGIDPAERNDKIYYLVAGATYKMNRNFHFAAQYVYSQRESDISLSTLSSNRFDYTNNLISFSIRAQL